LFYDKGNRDPAQIAALMDQQIEAYLAA
jgi:hypothetical protein